MLCPRCKHNVPEFLMQDTPNGIDHLILTDHPVTIFRDDLFGENEIKISMHVYVQKRFCSQMYLLTEAGLIEKQEPIIYVQNDKKKTIEVDNIYSSEGQWFVNSQKSKREG